ncbi:MAG: sigma-54-dependent Fis family transcriptional regulator [Desulfarculus sp.]|nr:sigma-54-dependent Fis family transcriptional regulator [Desulfarculus sp.]
MTLDDKALPHAGLGVLIVDDEANIRATLGLTLEAMGCRVVQAADGARALEALRLEPLDLAFLDLRLGRDNGLDLLPGLLAERPELAVVVITAHATFDTAVEAIKRGAQDYLPKPFTPAQIRHLVEQVAVRGQILRRAQDLEDRLRQAMPEARLETEAPAMQAVLEVVARAARSEVPVLLRGESGTGKEVVARVLHAGSPRAVRPFVVVNCPTLSEDLLASELFGHAKGAFTGALRDHPGRVEAAQGGTLFLDEIGELPASLQAKLLRFLQNKEFERVGENLTRTADVRVLAATNRDLEADIQAGHFREDLYYRLSVVEVTLPALRQRPEDILPLARHFMEFFARAARRPVPELTPPAAQALTRHAWPGNIRELRNALERAIVLASGPVLEPLDFPGRIAQGAEAVPSLGGDFTLEQVEEEHIRRVSGRAATLQEAAAILGVDASTLWRRKKRKQEGRV